MANFLDLPPELMLKIVGYLNSRRDLSSLIRCNRPLYWTLSDQFFTLAFQKRCQTLPIKSAVSQVFMHAVKHDSQNLMQWLVSREHASHLRGFIPVMKHVTYLHYAILQDAPKVAAQLVKHGTDIYECEFDYPDLTPLYLAVARPKEDVCGSLDGVLRIACSYALPRTATYLLTRGADPNTHSNFGFAAIHLAVMRRQPWRKFKTLSWLNDKQDSEIVLWDARVVQTVDALLHFGADPNLPAATSRIHACGPKCWRSLDCAHCGQRVLHIAAASGNKDVVALLLRKGANPKLADEEGYLPPFAAMAQGHGKIASMLLNRIRGRGRKVNLIIAYSQKSTALHIACRFALPDLVVRLVKRGADANATDSLGQTPLHEALGQDAPDLEDEIVDTLHHLASAGASPDAVTLRGETARTMGEKHGFGGVREMFQPYNETQLLHESGLEELTLDDSVAITKVTWAEHHIDGLFSTYRPRHIEGWGDETPPPLRPVYPDKTGAKAPTWVVKESYPSLPPPKPSTKKKMSSESKPDQCWSKESHETTEVTQPEVATATKTEKQGKKGGRKKKWTPLVV